VNDCSNIATGLTGELYLSDFSACFKMSFYSSKKNGEVTRMSYLSQPIASLTAFDSHSRFVCSGAVASGEVSLWDHVVGKRLLSYDLQVPGSTAKAISRQENNLIGVLDSSKIVSLFDIRQPNPVHRIQGFSKNSSDSILSFEVANNHILLGTTEGPVILPVNCNAHEESILSPGEPHKSQFISKDLLATCEIGSEDITIVNHITGEQSCLNIPGEQITDFGVSPSKESIAVVSTCSESGKHYLRLLKKDQGSFDWCQYLRLNRMPYRVVFTKPDELVVVDEQHFSSFSTSNKGFVQALGNKLSRYIR